MFVFNRTTNGFDVGRVGMVEFADVPYAVLSRDRVNCACRLWLYTAVLHTAL